MKRKLISMALVAIALVTFVVMGVSNIKQTDTKLQLKEVQLKDVSTDLKQLELKYQKLDQDLDAELHQKNVNSERIKQLETEKQQLEQQKQDLEKRLQARQAEKERIARLQTTKRVAAAAAPRSGVGSHNSCGWNPQMQYILQKESGCRWNARNPSSGAYGVCQALPASKMASAGADYMTNVNTQLRWCDSYAHSRYGGWPQAYSFWLSHKWW